MHKPTHDTRTIYPTAPYGAAPYDYCLTCEASVAEIAAAEDAARAAAEAYARDEAEALA